MWSSAPCFQSVIQTSCATETLIMNTHENCTRVQAPANTIHNDQASLASSRSDEDAPLTPTGLNPSGLIPTGRGAMDCKNRGNKILSCKTYLQVATFNARTIRTNDKRHELANNFNKCKLDVQNCA